MNPLPDYRLVGTALAGGFGTALGETHDRETAALIGPGSFVQIPTGEAHFA